MTRKEFYKVLFEGKPPIEELAGQKVNPLTDYAHLLIMQELEPLLREGITPEQRLNLDEDILNTLVDVADRAIKIGIDTATMVFTGDDPYDTYTDLTPLIDKKTLRIATNQPK